MATIEQRANSLEDDGDAFDFDLEHFDKPVRGR